MDQVKEYLRLAVKYRFWISVGLSALLPMIAYFVGAGSIKAEGTKKADEVKSAVKAVAPYKAGHVYNKQYSDVVKTKTEELTGDVNGAWRRLYERQAPLLTWPATPEGQPLPFREWTKKWPENVAPTEVTFATIGYMRAYDEFVDQVYQTFHPWNSEKGTGIVVAPPKEALLRPAAFDQNNPPSDLSAIWSAQEKLWVQRALLDVVAKVNKDAKDWDSAVIKQITALEVANSKALDQVSVAQGKALVPAKPLTAGGEAAAPVEAQPAAGGMDAYSQAGPSKGGAAGYGGGMGGGADAKSETVSYLDTSTDQYQVVPVSMTVLIDQNYINNLLVELANSPMAIQVMDYDQTRPATRVKKPEKGETPSFGGYGGGGYGGGGYGGSAAMFNYGGGGKGAAAYGGSMQSGYGQMGGGAYGGAAEKEKAGKSLRNRNLAKEKEDKEKAKKVAEVRIHDPYINIVEVTIHGQARFYNPPPAEQPSHSAGDAGTTEDAQAGDAESKAAPKVDDQGKAEATEPAEGEEKAKGDADADAKKTEPVKADDQAPDAGSADEPKSRPEETQVAPEASKGPDEPKAKAAAPPKAATPKS